MTPTKTHTEITDAFEHRLGYALLQLHEEEQGTCKKKNYTCKWRIIWTNNTVLKPNYKHVPPIYLEVIGIRWALLGTQYFSWMEKEALLGMHRPPSTGLDIKRSTQYAWKDQGPLYGPLALQLHQKYFTGKKNLMGDARLRAPDTQAIKWVTDPTTPEMDAEFWRRVLVRQVKATNHV